MKEDLLEEKLEESSMDLSKEEKEIQKKEEKEINSQKEGKINTTEGNNQKEEDIENVKEKEDKKSTSQLENNIKEDSKSTDNEKNIEKSKTDKKQESNQKSDKKELKKQKSKQEIQETKKDETKFKKSNKQSRKLEEEVKEMQDDKEEKAKRHKKRVKKIIISIIMVAIVMIFISTVFALTNINNEKIVSGVSIEGIEVSGLSKEEAIAKLKTIYSEKLEKNIELKYEEFESELNPTLMEVSYDVEKAVNDAYLVGRDSNIFVNNYNILFTLIGKKDIDTDMSINEEVTRQTITDIGTNLPGVMVESTYTIEGENLIITTGRAGVVVNTDELLSKVKNLLKDIDNTENYIEIPVENKEPTPIDIDKIHSEIYTEAKDAYYTKDPFTVYPEVEGVDFNVEEAKAIIAAEVKEEYVIPLIITKPNVTINQIGTEAFPDQLSTFTTRYDASDRDRTTNLVLACQKINGKVIMPGETFSYNDTLGPRTYAAGYKNAKVYENGQVVDGIGGGICQISSTLYNAALMSDMEIVERRNHQFVTSYVKEGRDATVVYGLTDFKFKNTRTYPVKIVASASGGIATVSIFGIKEADREYTYTFNTEVISTIPYTTKYVEDSSLAPGQEVVKQKGANGVVTQTYMTKMLNGKIVSTNLLSKDTYSAMQRIINRGTVKSSTSTTQTQTQIQSQQSNSDTSSTHTNNSGSSLDNTITNNGETNAENVED